jgi:phage gpG-like protein
MKNGETIEVGEEYKKFTDELRKEVKGSYVDVGVFGGTNEKTGDSILRYAVVNEFGWEIRNPRSGGSTIVIPSRPFMRRTADDNLEKYADMLKDGLERIGAGIEKTAGVLTRVGIKIRGDIQANIRDGNWEPNALSTIERKRGSTRPLIDTGTLRKSISFKLDKGTATKW